MVIEKVKVGMNKDSKNVLDKYGYDKWFFIANFCKDKRLSPFQTENYIYAENVYKTCVEDIKSKESL